MFLFLACNVIFDGCVWAREFCVKMQNGGTCCEHELEPSGTIKCGEFCQKTKKNVSFSGGSVRGCALLVEWVNGLVF